MTFNYISIGSFIPIILLSKSIASIKILDLRNCAPEPIRSSSNLKRLVGSLASENQYSPLLVGENVRVDSLPWLIFKNYVFPLLNFAILEHRSTILRFL